MSLNGLSQKKGRSPPSRANPSAMVFAAPTSCSCSGVAADIYEKFLTGLAGMGQHYPRTFVDFECLDFPKHVLIV